ncbi:hypothetical protein NLX83_33555 [Allokutzneria sp. A3M-2-11 16]|uniref:family 43 glycosylhydrolase n=1 Tax=Allokutzneria sp. A3M-2-11 16 TaxID=2962043 RepID=UPI0020B881C1|nr:family 43 glycosylhydrolase [Allokutzneria sp. A3M-2-11 16]MCP3804211.1 hypothetical protein [Allokutzneria sp. A3M-2-11 16]
MPALPDGVSLQEYSEVRDEVSAGEWRHLYDPTIGEDRNWYLNDHTFVRDAGGTWHMIGITHAEPLNPLDEKHFAHATAPSLHGPWAKQPFAMSVDPGYHGEAHLWAPHIVLHDGRYYMFYCGGDADHSFYAINLATSTDLRTWTRHPGGPLFRDGFDARDPFVTRIDGRWVIFYTATVYPDGGNFVVAYRTSDDLVHWSGRKFAYSEPLGGVMTESPFLVRRGSDWYLFIGPRRGYVGTDVFRSKDPLNFNANSWVGNLPSHAAEVIFAEGRHWVTHAGWGQRGVYLAPLNWQTTFRGVRVTAPDYRVDLQTSPTSELRELSVRMRDGTWRNVLDNHHRGSGPYLGIGLFGATEKPRAAPKVSVQGGTVALQGVPIGQEKITVDWKLDFHADSFDSSLTWHVAAPTRNPLWELAFSMDTWLGTLGDDQVFPRRGDAPGFTRWAMATGLSVTMAMAYRRGSAWAEANRWYSDGESSICWQPVWQPNGGSIAPGDYFGGTWRIGVSARARDRELAERLANGINTH